jgi:limonene-1,2-epoxide hydrolase
VPRLTRLAVVHTRIMGAFEIDGDKITAWPMRR